MEEAQKKNGRRNEKKQGKGSDGKSINEIKPRNNKSIQKSRNI